MIKIALKHWIYEKCIDVFFSVVGRNFDIPVKYPFHSIKVGDKIKMLEARQVDIHKHWLFYDCEVINTLISRRTGECGGIAITGPTWYEDGECRVAYGIFRICFKHILSIKIK